MGAPPGGRSLPLPVLRGVDTIERKLAATKMLDFLASFQESCSPKPWPYPTSGNVFRSVVLAPNHFANIFFGKNKRGSTSSGLRCNSIASSMTAQQVTDVNSFPNCLRQASVSDKTIGIESLAKKSKGSCPRIEIEHFT